MANIELNTVDVPKIYFGTREAEHVFLGLEVVHVRNHILYSAKKADTEHSLEIISGNAASVFTDVLEASGALT